MGEKCASKYTTRKGTDRQTHRRTSRLLDRIGPVGRFDENITKLNKIVYSFSIYGWNLRQSRRWALFIWKDSGFGLFQEMTQKTGRKSASCQLALCKKAPPYCFYEILAVCDRFKPICSRVRSAAGPRAARESLNRAAGLLAAILPIRAATALRFLAEFFRI